MKNLYRGFCAVEETIVGILFFSMVVLVLFSALGRTTGHPIAWSLDIAQLLLAWSSFLGADVAFRNGKLVGLDLVTRKLSDKVQKTISLVILLLMMAALVIFLIYGIRLSLDSWKRSFQTLPISYSFVTLSLPTTSALMLLTGIGKIKRAVLNFITPAA